jgi:RNA polymerase sigma factor (sigma-70 family)
VEHLLRELAPQVLAVVARRHTDFAAAEDAVQEALMAAAVQWPESGLPGKPLGWLVHVALRRAADHLRSDVARRRREAAVAGEMWAEWAFVPPADSEVNPDSDDTLALVFMCCHPALTPPSAIALTLRAVGGLTTAEIARAFMVPEPTMAQRISRAKQSIRAAGSRFAMPDAHERGERLVSVLHVLYLMFNEGYTSSAGPLLQRVDLTAEAIRLARAVHALLPDDPEVMSLLALMLLTDARREARTGPGGELIPLDEQDRSLWRRDMITEGVGLVERALSRQAVGPYQVQAAIAAVHSESEAEDTDWPQILALYDVLNAMTSNPMVALNRAVAVAMVRGPTAGLEAVEELARDGALRGHYRVDVVRGHLHERAGNLQQAVEHFRAAADGTASIPERNFLLARAVRLSSEMAKADGRGAC